MHSFVSTAFAVFASFTLATATTCGIVGDSLAGAFAVQNRAGFPYSAAECRSICVGYSNSELKSYAIGSGDNTCYCFTNSAANYNDPSEAVYTYYDVDCSVGSSTTTTSTATTTTPAVCNGDACNSDAGCCGGAVCLPAGSSSSTCLMTSTTTSASPSTTSANCRVVYDVVLGRRGAAPMGRLVCDSSTTSITSTTESTTTSTTTTSVCRRFLVRRGTTTIIPVPCATSSTTTASTTSSEASSTSTATTTTSICVSIETVVKRGFTVIQCVPSSTSTSTTVGTTSSETSTSSSTSSMSTQSSGSSSTTSSASSTSSSAPQCTNGVRTIDSRKCTSICGFDRLGGDIPGVLPQKFDTFEGCTQACAAMPRCLSAQYHEESQYCYFKDSRNELVANELHDTVDCDPAPQCTNGVRIVKGRKCTSICGFDRLGGDIPGVSPLQSDDFAGCVQACAAIPGCVSAQYHEESKYCYFKDARNELVATEFHDTVDCDPLSTSSTSSSSTSSGSSSSTSGITSSSATSSSSSTSPKSGSSSSTSSKSGSSSKTATSTASSITTASGTKATWAAWESSKSPVKTTKTDQYYSSWESEKSKTSTSKSKNSKTSTSKSTKPKTTTVGWEQWQGAPYTVTFTKTYYVPCSTGWQTVTTTIYSGYEKETLKPSTVEMTTYKTTVTVWDTKTVVYVTVPATPTPVQGQPYNTWQGQASPVNGQSYNTWQSQASPVQGVSTGSQSWEQTWVAASATPVKGATVSDWNTWNSSPVKTPEAATGTQNWSSWSSSSGNGAAQTGPVKGYTGEAVKTQVGAFMAVVGVLGALML